MLWLILIILLLVLLVAAVPAWPYSSGWGYSPSGILAVIVLVLLVLWLTGVIHVSLGSGSTTINVNLPATPKP